MDASDRVYHPTQDEPQLTLRAIIAGCVIGAPIAIMNLYAGLMTGLVIGGSLIAAILSYAVVAALSPRRRLGVLETNIAQTAGSAAGTGASAAGLMAAVPALALMGIELSMGQLIAWGFVVAFMGILFYIPLRRQIVTRKQLVFPSGTAAASTIVSLIDNATFGRRSALVLLLSAIFAAIWSLAGYFEQAIVYPPLAQVGGIFAVAAAWSFSLGPLGPLFAGAGYLIGTRALLSMMLGAIIGWAGVGRLAVAEGWTTAEITINGGLWGWILWPGIILILTDTAFALLPTLRALPALIRTALPGHRREASQADDLGDESALPPRAWLLAIAVSSIVICWLGWAWFGLPVPATAIAIVLSGILALISLYCVGLTDINPVAPLGVVTQTTVGSLFSGGAGLGLAASTVTLATNTEAGDVSQDLKTGGLLGASPRRQFIAQCTGLATGIIVSVTAYSTLDIVGSIERGSMPAPFVHMYASIAKVTGGGTSVLPEGAVLAMVGAFVLAIVLRGLQRTKIAPYLPSCMAMGMGMMLPAAVPLSLLVCGLPLILWFRQRRQNGAVGFAVACGLIAGESMLTLGTTLFDLVLSAIS